MGDLTRNKTLPDTCTKADVHDLIDTATLQVGSVTNSALQNGAVSADKLASDSVTHTKLRPGAHLYHGIVSGLADALTLPDVSTAYTAYADGDVFVFEASATNTTATPTLEVRSLGAKTIQSQSGATLRPGSIKAGCKYEVRYDASNSRWMLMGVGEAYRVFGDFSVGGTANAVTLTNFLEPIALFTGLLLEFEVDADNTGPVTLNVNGLGAKALVERYDTPLVGGDLVAGQRVMAVYDGTNFQLLSQTANYPPQIAGIGEELAVGRSGADITVAANRLVLSDANGRPKMASAVSLTLSHSNGKTQNGRDEVSASANWWYVYVCYDGTDTFGLLSRSDAAPDAAEVSYTHFAKVGVAYFDNTNFLQFASLRHGRWCLESEQLDVTANLAPQAHSVSHPFSAMPLIIRVVLACIADEDGYVAGEELQGDVIWTYNGSGEYLPTYTAWGSTTAIKMIQRVEAGGVYYRHATTGVVALPAASGSPLLLTNFKWKIYAEF